MKNPIDIFVDYLCNYIVPNKLHKKEFGLYVGRNDLIDIRYNHRLYHVNIIKSGNELYWKLTPHFEGNYITIIDTYESFDRLLFAIKENDRVIH